MPTTRPRTNIALYDDTAEQLQFILLVERARTNDSKLCEEEILASIVEERYTATQAAFNEAMKQIKEIKRNEPV